VDADVSIGDLIRTAERDDPAAAGAQFGALYDELHAIAERQLRRGGPELTLARALRESGQLAEAEPLFRQALEGFEPDNADTRVLRLSAQTGLGRTLTGRGRAAEALPLLEEGVRDSRTHMGAEHWRTADAELALGECLLALRRYAPAEAPLRHAAAVLNGERRKQPIPAREADAMVQRLYRAWGKRAAS
jgi:hypothetical protein